MFRAVDPNSLLRTAPFRRGERDRLAMDMGDGSTISMGDQSSVVRERESGVRADLPERGFEWVEIGDSREREVKSVRSVCEGKSVSLPPMVETEDRGVSAEHLFDDAVDQCVCAGGDCNSRSCFWSADCTSDATSATKIP